MSILANNVFLVSGQFTKVAVGGRPGLRPEIEQCVVIAESEEKVYSCLAQRMPNFKPVGHATLQDYEATAAKLRAVCEGSSSEWEVLEA